MEPTATAPADAPASKGGTSKEGVIENPILELERVDFGVKKSLRYHSRVRAYYERLDIWTKWLSAVAGASAFAVLLGDSKSLSAAALTFIVTALALLDIIVAFSQKARLHQDLYRRFSDLAIEIAKLQHPIAPDVAQMRAKRIAIEADEPPAIDVLEKWCWNLEAASRGGNQGDFHQLSKWQKLRASMY
jgi:hypothetical protein